ncbi:MAG: ATP-binding cassette domain-containing protein, partial [Bacteroidota bacterium]
EIQDMREKELRPLRKEIQIIFQDPYSSLNPRIQIGKAIQEPMKVHGIGSNDADRKERVMLLLEKVGLSREHYSRYPHAFSGGQRQRICIARTLAVSPKFVICDESVSALDVSIQAQVLNLLKDLQEEMGLTYIFISHDLSVVKFMSDRILVMKEGKIVEQANAGDIYANPQTDYTRQLIEAVPEGTLEALREAKMRRGARRGDN